jgi:hypothetical protein
MKNMQCKDLDDVEILGFLLFQKVHQTHQLLCLDVVDTLYQGQNQQHN